MREGECERELYPETVWAEGFDILVAQARVRCCDKPRQIGLNHDYNMPCSNLTREC